ncbi:MAG: carboxypeptidase-like regulatory domain-containing protein [Acidobacteriia bacterium]|nr:carboxypeptidase-like regulatory domain-containing protein [Terriglobia bacterium]
MRDGASFPAVLRCCPRRSLLVHWLAALVILTVSYPQPGHSQDAQNSNAPSNSLRGTVINSVTREPVARALVSTADNRFAAFTDDQGRFEFELPRIETTSNGPAEGMAFYNASAQLMARKPGFLDSGMSTSPPQSAVGDDITIALVPESLIVGRVNLPSSNQSDRITVQVYKRQVRDGRGFWAPAAGATTRSNGEFRIANLMAGTYKIFTSELMDRDPITFDPRGQLYGYPPTYYPTAGDFASAAAITLEASKTFQVELSPVLQPYYPVRIAVTNFQAQGGINVSVALQGHQDPGYSLGYNGEAIEGMLPNGIYTIEATLQQGQQTATGNVSITVKDAPLTHASMAVLPNGSIPVSITDERSGERSGAFFRQGTFTREQKAEVFLQPADDFDSGGFASLRPPRKPNDNDLVLENVRPGRYWLKVAPSLGYVASAVAGSADLLRQPLVVGPGGASLPIDVVLRDDGAAIDGTVEGMPPVPADRRSHTVRFGPVAMPAGPYVYCIPLPDSSGRFTASWVSPQGTFQLQQVPPGAYRVLAFDRQQNELECHNAEAMRAYEDKGPIVRLGPGQTEQVRVPLISTKE